MNFCSVRQSNTCRFAGYDGSVLNFRLTSTAAHKLVPPSAPSPSPTLALTRLQTQSTPPSAAIKRHASLQRSTPAKKPARPPANAARPASNSARPAAEAVKMKKKKKPNKKRGKFTEDFSKP